MKKLYWLFPISLIACLAILSLSFREVEIFYTVEGKVVDADNQPVFNAIVALENKESEEVRYYEPTKPDGNFKFSFNAVEGKPVVLHIKKKDFAKVSKEIIPSSAKKYVGLQIKLKNPKSVTFHPTSPVLSEEEAVVSASIIPVK